jgi:hypothetical protein
MKVQCSTTDRVELGLSVSRCQFLLIKKESRDFQHLGLESALSFAVAEKKLVERR